MRSIDETPNAEGTSEPALPFRMVLQVSGHDPDLEPFGIFSDEKIELLDDDGFEVRVTFPDAPGKEIKRIPVTVIAYSIQQATLA